MDIKKIEQMGMEQGFSHVVLLDCDTIELKPEVRQMCAADTCHKYDKCWSCPPGCGSLEECEAKVRQYKYGIIVQTVGELEDAFDGEGMMETEARHKEYFVEFEKKLREIIRVVTFWNNILAESSKSPAKQLFGVEMRSEADYEYLLDLNQVNSLWRLWKGNSVFVVNNSEL